MDHYVLWNIEELYLARRGALMKHQAVFGIWTARQLRDEGRGLCQSLLPSATAQAGVCWIGKIGVL
jgi:hypothetical protein